MAALDERLSANTNAKRDFFSPFLLRFAFNPFISVLKRFRARREINYLRLLEKAHKSRSEKYFQISERE
jgi:hypothetical protein